MKKIIIVLLTMFLSFNCLAECQWSAIVETKDGFLYPKNCHLKVGKLVEESKLREQQVQELNKSIELKDLTIKIADERIKNWRDTSYELEERVMKQKRWSTYNDYLYFGGGVVLTILSGWAIGQAAK
ncbi:MAG TPA: hypothetical protein VI911_12040 [Patescibacteria group bacterium]|nr:hypothetical protein [Patescibacteria group bacterium]